MMMKGSGLFLGFLFAVVSVPTAVGQQASAPKWTTASTYTVARGDSVPIIVRRVKYPDVTESQMYYAVVQANLNNFSMDTVERVLPGMKLKIPPQAEVAKVDVKMADTYMASLRKAETLFAEGVGLEHQGDMKGAVGKYIAAAKIGHAYAAQRLGQLYDLDVTRTLPRDFQESIKYYHEARTRGRDIKGPGLPSGLPQQR